MLGGGLLRSFNTPPPRIADMRFADALVTFRTPQTGVSMVTEV